MSSAVARTFSSVPERSSAATWKAISELIATNPASDARAELDKVTNEAATLIAEQAMGSAPIIVTGSGPRVRIYCAYDEDATDGSKAKENALTFDATSGDWAVSLPCPAEDLSWVTSSLADKGSRVTARDMSLGIKLSQCDGEADDSTTVATKSSTISVDWEAFLNR